MLPHGKTIVDARIVPDHCRPRIEIKGPGRAIFLFEIAAGPGGRSVLRTLVSDDEVADAGLR